LDLSGGGGLEDGHKAGGSTAQAADQAGGNFNASDGGDSGDHVCSSANHELDGDHRNAYTLQHGGLIEHA
jgi:hypothetical protein